MKRKFTTDHLPFRSLVLDPEYQREIIKARVKHLTENWNLDDVGAITVSIRPGEPRKAYVIDGQHRVRAAMDLGLGDTKVLCHVYRGLSKEEEARKFLAANDSRAVTPFDKYKAGIVAGDETALKVRDIAEGFGWNINGGAGDGQIACVGQVMKLCERDPMLLEDTLRVTTEAWGTRAAAVEQSLIGGLSQVIGSYNGELDHGALAKKLAKYKGGASALVGDARGLAEYKPISIRRAVAEIVVTTYNKGRRSGQLPVL